MGLFSRKVNYAKIGAYQFNNLITNPVSFLLIDLRPKNENPYIQKANSMSAEQAINYIAEENLPKESAIVVICQDGKNSAKLAQKLDKDGFINVVVLEDGIKGLSS